MILDYVNGRLVITAETTNEKEELQWVVEDMRNDGKAEFNYSTENNILSLVVE